MAKMIYEIEESVSFTDYHTIRQRIALDFDSSVDSEDDVRIAIVSAQKTMEIAVKKLLARVSPDRLSGGLSHQWVYKNGRRKKIKKGRV